MNTYIQIHIYTHTDAHTHTGTWVGLSPLACRGIRGSQGCWYVALRPSGDVTMQVQWPRMVDTGCGGQDNLWLQFRKTRGIRASSSQGRGPRGHGGLWSLDGLQLVSLVTQSCSTLCNYSTPGLPVHHQLPEFTQTHVHRVSDAIQPSHPLSSPSPLALNPSQHQSQSQLWGIVKVIYSKIT